MSTRIIASGCFWAVVLLLAGCTSEETARPWPAGGSSYTFDRPDSVMELPKELDEISGLAVLDDGRLAAVQDEDGILYLLDPESGEILEAREFGGPGDYEAISLAGERLFILQSDGTLHRFPSWRAPALQGDTLHLDLPRLCDAEGLRYDAAGDRLLVACKDEAGVDREHARAVYAFSTDGEPIAPNPVFTLDATSFSSSLEDHPVNKAVRSAVSRRVDLSGFAPSDLAIHPITGNIFVLSSVREAVVEVEPDGRVVGMWPLSEDLVGQPEGLDFLPNGDLFLSSEAGDRKRGVLLRFRYRG